jgi:hypothetical protein
MASNSQAGPRVCIVYSEELIEMEVANRRLKEVKSAKRSVETGIRMFGPANIKGVAKKKGCFEFHYFCLRFLKENDRYPFSLLRI